MSSLLTSKEFAPITRHEEHYCRYICAIVRKFATDRSKRMSYIQISEFVEKEGKVKVEPIRIKAILDRERAAGRLENVIEVSNAIWTEKDVKVLELFKEALIVRSKKLAKIAKALKTDVVYDSTKVNNSYTNRKDLWS